MIEAVVDTNVFIHAIIRDSKLHEDARRLLDSIDMLYVPIIVLYEVVWALKKLGLKQNDVKDVIDRILESPKVRIVTDTGEDIKRSIEIISESKLSLSHFNDKIVLSAAERIKKPLATYDNELKKEAIKYKVSILK